jgi:hypothetical protein
VTLTESRPGDLIRIKLFLKPFRATNTAELVPEPEGEHTVVTWSLTGQNTFVAKAVHMIMDMDRMIGGSFEKGLADMKSVVEGRS